MWAWGIQKAAKDNVKLAIHLHKGQCAFGIEKYTLFKYADFGMSGVRGGGDTKQQNTHKHRKPQTQQIVTAKEKYL